MPEGLKELMKTGKCKIKKGDVNKVICENDEIRMINIRNRKEKVDAEDIEEEKMRNI